MPAKITINSHKELIGKRIWLLLIEDDDYNETVVDAQIFEGKPASTGAENWIPVKDSDMSGVFNGRDKATLTFNDLGRLTSIS